MTPDPLAVSDPPVMAKPPLIVELAATVNPPPEMTSGSEAVMLFTDSTVELIVTVDAPGTSMTTLSVGAGDRSPCSSCYPRPRTRWWCRSIERVARSWRFSSTSISGRRRRWFAARYDPPRRNRINRVFDMVQAPVPASKMQAGRCPRSPPTDRRRLLPRTAFRPFLCRVGVTRQSTNPCVRWAGLPSGLISKLAFDRRPSIDVHPRSLHGPVSSLADRPSVYRAEIADQRQKNKKVIAARSDRCLS